MKPLFSDPKWEVVMVNEFINNNLGCWDKDKLEEKLNAPDVATVSPIYIGHFKEDFWVWTQAKTRIFHVRSCYRLLSTKYFSDNVSRCCIAYLEEAMEIGCLSKDM
jgi:hypothetical protein